MSTLNFKLNEKDGEFGFDSNKFDLKKYEKDKAERKTKFLDESNGYICTLWMK